jgi:predicted transcriptional regulator
MTEQPPRPHRSLPTFIMNLVEEGHEEPHRALFAIIKSCVIHGWSEAETWGLLTNFLHPGGKTLQDLCAKNPRRAQRSFTRTWDKAAKQLTERSRPVQDSYETFAALSAIAREADTVAWPGRSGPTDRLVLDGLLARGWGCIRTSGLIVGVRQIADHVGVSKTQAANALTRLSAGPFVTRHTRSGGYSYTLHLPAHSDDAHDIPDMLARLSLRAAACAPGTHGNPLRGGSICPSSAQVATTLGAHDVWRIPGLSGNPRRIYAVIEAAPSITTAEITGFMKIHRTTVTRALDRLHSAGLIDSTHGRWHRTHLTLNEVANQLGAAGLLQDQAARHRQERHLHQRMEQIRSQKAHDEWEDQQRIIWFAECLPEVLAHFIRLGVEQSIIDRTQWFIRHEDQIPAYLRGDDIPGIVRPFPASRPFASGTVRRTAERSAA